MHTRRYLVAVLLLPAPLLAQNTWIVAQAGGGHFNNLAPAVAAAQDGDLILVQPGYYDVVAGGIVTNKGLRILGGPGRTLSGGGGPIVDLRGLPGGRTFVLDGFDLTRTGLGAALGPVNLQSNAGAVHL